MSLWKADDKQKELNGPNEPKYSIKQGVSLLQNLKLHGSNPLRGYFGTDTFFSRVKLANHYWFWISHKYPLSALFL